MTKKNNEPVIIYLKGNFKGKDLYFWFFMIVLWYICDYLPFLLHIIDDVFNLEFMAHKIYSPVKKQKNNGKYNLLIVNYKIHKTLLSQIFELVKLT